MESELIIKCPLCNEYAKLVYDKYPGYQEGSVFELYHCASCDTTFTMPRKDVNEIYELIYKNGENVRWYNRYWRYADVVKRKNKPFDYLVESEVAYWAVKESLRQIATKRGNSPLILEFGCGLGYLTYSLNKEGYNIKGLDISHEAIDYAIRNYGDFYVCAELNMYSATHEREYDVIIMTEVIEHLNDVNSIMKYLKGLLKSNGKIILTTPNKSFYPKTMLWATDLPPVHCWWLSEDSISHIAVQLDMAVTFLNFKQYYSKHVVWEDCRRINIPFTPQVFNKDGGLISPVSTIIKKESAFIKIIKGIGIIRVLYSKIRYYRVKNNPNILLPGVRGPVLCAILKKN